MHLWEHWKEPLYEGEEEEDEEEEEEEEEGEWRWKTRRKKEKNKQIVKQLFYTTCPQVLVCVRPLVWRRVQNL